MDLNLQRETMLNTIIVRLEKTISGGAVIIAFFSIVSKLLGLVRDRLLATMFGAGDILDIYYAAFKIPDFIFNILVLGALSSAFIPVFIKYWHQDGGLDSSRLLRDENDKLITCGKSECWQIANSLLNIIFITLSALSVLAIWFAPALISWLVPGFDIDKQAETVSLTRIMLVSIIFFGVSNIFSGILNSFRKFFIYSLAPVMYNFGIIIGIMFLVPIWGAQGLAWGVVIGSFLHMMIQLPAVIKYGFKYKLNFDFKHKGVRRVIKLMLPRTIGLAAGQINQLVITFIGSSLATGSIAVFNLANNLQSVPLNLFGVSLAVAAFPVFSQAMAESNHKKFVIHFSKTFRKIFYLVIPVTVLMLLLRAQIVRLVFGAGSFDWNDTILTAQTLGFFGLSLFAQSLIPLLARSFYALENTKTPVLIGIFSVLVNIFASFYFGRLMGVAGLALAFSFASVLNMILLMIFLRLKVGYLDDWKIIISVLKILFASFVMAIIVYGMLYFVAPFVNMRSFLGIMVQSFSAGLLGLTVYIILTLILRCDEIEIFRKGWLKIDKIIKKYR